MKRTSVVFGLFLVVSVFAAAPCLAEPAAPPATAPAAATATPQKAAKKAEKKTGTYLGEIMEIDLKANKMLVAPKNSSLAMVLNTSKVKKGVDALKVGDWVEVTFEAKVGTMYALTVSKVKTPEVPKGSVLKREKPANHP